MEVVQSLLLLLSKLVDQGAPELSTKGLALRTGVEADRCVQLLHCRGIVLPGRVL